MKKFISLILAIILTVLAFPIICFAAQPRLSMSSVEAVPGEIFEVDVNLANNPGIVSANLKVEFGEGLTLVGATNGTAFSKLTYIPPKQLSSGGTITSSCQFVWMGFDIADKDIKDGKVLTLKFKLNEKAKSGSTYNISFYNEPGNVIDRNLNEIALSAQSTIKVSDDADFQGMSHIIEFLQRIMDFFNSLMRELIALFSTNM